MATAALANMALVFGLVQIANKYELDAPENTDILRISYASVQLFSLALIAYMYLKVTKKNDQTELIYKDAKPSFNAADQEPELIKTNFRDYDVSQLKSLAFQTVLGVVIIAVMHFKYGYLRPLLLQSVLAFKTLYGVPLIKVHILGFPATGELQRPWKAPNPLGIEEPATAKEVKKEEKKQEKKKISSKKHD